MFISIYRTVTLGYRWIRHFFGALWNMADWYPSGVNQSRRKSIPSTLVVSKNIDRRNYQGQRSKVNRPHPHPPSSGTATVNVLLSVKGASGKCMSPKTAKPEENMPWKKRWCRIQPTSSFSRMKSRSCPPYITRIVRSLSWLIWTDCHAGLLVVSYHSTGINAEKKPPMFQIIMEYVDGCVSEVFRTTS